MAQWARNGALLALIAASSGIGTAAEPIWWAGPAGTPEDWFDPAYWWPWVPTAGDWASVRDLPEVI